MKIYKFGGASVRDAAAVKNAAKIINLNPQQDLVVVVSAMGKMTNALESIVLAYRCNDDSLSGLCEKFFDYHTAIISDLQMGNSKLMDKMHEIKSLFKAQLEKPTTDNFDYDYDQIVSYGEILSSAILSGYLNHINVLNTLADARNIVRTDNTYREGKVIWDKTTELIQEAWAKAKSAAGGDRIILVSQGYISHTAERNTTTLGREGSDFSAAIFAYALDAESVTIWKDVPGMLNADPKYFSDAVKLKRISYKEAIELAYYGASVIHPKTIKPLQNKEISLIVKSFLNPEEEGTLIESSTFSDSLIPSFIFKTNQVLISFIQRDFSFIAEENLSQLFRIFSDNGVKINMMQNSAINFSICIDYEPEKLDAIRAACKDDYEVLYNKPCELVTIRHYNNETIGRLAIGKKVLLEQRSRSTVRMVLMDV